MSQTREFPITQIFNQRYRVGSAVRYWPNVDQKGSPKLGITESPAFDTRSGPKVKVHGTEILLTQIESIEDRPADADEKLIIKEMQKHLASSTMVHFKINVPMAMVVVSQLQIASRHPHNAGTSVELSLSFAKMLIEKMPFNSQMVTLLNRGFDPSQDVTPIKV